MFKLFSKSVYFYVLTAVFLITVGLIWNFKMNFTKNPFSQLNLQPTMKRSAVEKMIAKLNEGEDVSSAYGNNLRVGSAYYRHQDWTLEINYRPDASVPLEEEVISLKAYQESQISQHHAIYLAFFHNKMKIPDDQSVVVTEENDQWIVEWQNLNGKNSHSFDYYFKVWINKQTAKIHKNMVAP